ncbi:MAG: DUF2264 domain-containing protein [Mediterranea sp.]|nr:DUF2264 domain-containing protein [Mediterranea sp.]
MITRRTYKNCIWAAILPCLLWQACTGKAATDASTNVFTVNNPDYRTSPLTGMTRRHWIDAATYLLSGAFGYIDSLDSPMKFPKQLDKAYPKHDGQIPTEKLEGLCRTLFIATPLLKENPDLELHGIKVADYYRHQLLNLIDPESPGFIKHRPENGGPNQNLVEFGALAISLSIIPEVIWEPFTREQKDVLAATMLSYGDGPTVNSNWKFFNIFILSFFKAQGYTVNEELLIKYVTEALAFYRGQGWYNDSPAYDYYSMWAFQMYGPVWAQLYGNDYYPEHARQFMSNLHDLAGNYPYMFNREGRMNMWGRSICYRFGSITPLAMLGFLDDPDINHGWMRRIASGTMLQFLQHPGFLEDHVPSLGFYGPFAPAVQIYSCRGSAYWCGKAFMALLLPEDNAFWTAKENNGAWENELQTGQVYNKFQEGSHLLITGYPNCGGAEMRSWCHEKVADDWQQFRSSENYNKLAYHTEFPWMADGEHGEVSMNYAVLNGNKEWEVLRLYTFKGFGNGIYRRDAVLETNADVQFRLADIPLPDGVLRVDKVITPIETDIRLGHYALPQTGDRIMETTVRVNATEGQIISNGEYQLALIPLQGWGGIEAARPTGLHPVSDVCAVAMATDRIPVGERIYITLQLWKKGNKPFTPKELSPIGSVEIIRNGDAVEVVMKDGEKKTVMF